MLMLNVKLQSHRLVLFIDDRVTRRAVLRFDLQLVNMMKLGILASVVLKFFMPLPCNEPTLLA